MISYPATRVGEQALQELKEHSIHYDTTDNLADALRGVQKRCCGYEVLVSWVGFGENEDETWDLLQQILEDLPVCWKKFYIRQVIES